MTVDYDNRFIDLIAICKHIFILRQAYFIKEYIILKNKN